MTNPDRTAWNEECPCIPTTLRGQWMYEWTVRPQSQEHVVMESKQKMIAAAQRAARRLARSEGTSYQSCLDVVARNAGRRHWNDFTADPVPIDEATRLGAIEPDHTLISHDAQLVACLEHALAMDAGSFMAGPCDPNGRTVLLYSGRGSRFGHGVDARGVSLRALARSIQAAATDGDRAMIQDVAVRWSIGERRVDEDFLPVVTVTLDGSAPVADMTLLGSGESATDDRADEIRRREAAVDRAVDEAPVPSDPMAEHEMLDALVLASHASGMYDIEIEAGRLEATIHYVSPSRHRLMRTIPSDWLRRMTAMSKDRGRIDPMETRVSQYGDWSCEMGGGSLATIHVATEPSEFGETLRLGFHPFTRREHRIVRSYEMPREPGILLGHSGLIRRSEKRSDAGDLIVHSGTSQAHRDAFVANAIDQVPNTDVVVHDPSETVRNTIAERWMRSDNRMLIDPNDVDGSAFNPLHPDMTVNGIVDAMSSIVTVLAPERATTPHDHVTGLMIGLAEALSASPKARALIGGDRGVVDLPMIHRAARALSIDRHGSLLDDLVVEARGCRRATMELMRHVSHCMSTRASLAEETAHLLSFCENEAIARMLSPRDPHEGMALARAILLRRSTATIIVGGEGHDGSLVAGLVLDAVMRIRSENTGRPVHVHTTRADDLPSIPWLASALRGDRRPVGSTVTIGLDSAGGIWRHAGVESRERSSGRADERRGLGGIARWIVDEVRTAHEREDIARAMSVRASDVPVHTDPVRAMEVTSGGTTLLRRIP